MTPLTPFEARLRAELMGGIARDQKRRARRRVVVPAVGTLALVVAVAVVAVASRPGSGPVAPEVASAGAVVVHEAGGMIEVTVADLEAGPDDVRSELAEAGVTAAVELLAVQTRPRSPTLEVIKEQYSDRVLWCWSVLPAAIRMETYCNTPGRSRSGLLAARRHW